MILIGVLTIPICIGVILLPAGIISLITGEVQEDNSYKERGKKHNVDKQQEILAYLNQEYMKTNKCVAFRYARPSIINKLIEYIEYGRADNIKEALNTYENEIVLLTQQNQLHIIANSSAFSKKILNKVNFSEQI